MVPSIIFFSTESKRPRWTLRFSYGCFSSKTTDSNDKKFCFKNVFILISSAFDTRSMSIVGRPERLKTRPPAVASCRSPRDSRRNARYDTRRSTLTLWRATLIDDRPKLRRRGCYRPVGATKRARRSFGCQKKKKHRKKQPFDRFEWFFALCSVGLKYCEKNIKQRPTSPLDLRRFSLFFRDRARTDKNGSSRVKNVFNLI